MDKESDVAIYHCSVRIFSRAQGHSAVAAAAYRAGAMLKDKRRGMTHRYHHRKGVETAFVKLPPGAPQIYADREFLWNEAEAKEVRKNARTARELILALPYELDLEQRLNLARDMSSWLVERYQVAVDTAVHSPVPETDHDPRNYHAHLLFTTRALDEDGFGAKTRILDDKTKGPEEVELIRLVWETLANAALREAGHHDIQIDRRRIDEQDQDTRLDSASLTEHSLKPNIDPEAIEKEEDDEEGDQSAQGEGQLLPSQTDLAHSIEDDKTLLPEQQVEDIPAVEVCAPELRQEEDPIEREEPLRDDFLISEENRVGRVFKLLSSTCLSTAMTFKQAFKWLINSAKNSFKEYIQVPFCRKKEGISLISSFARGAQEKSSLFRSLFLDKWPVPTQYRPQSTEKHSRIKFLDSSFNIYNFNKLVGVVSDRIQPLSPDMKALHGGEGTGHSPPKKGCQIDENTPSNRGDLIYVDWPKTDMAMHVDTASAESKVIQTLIDQSIPGSDDMSAEYQDLTITTLHKEDVSGLYEGFISEYVSADLPGHAEQPELAVDQVEMQITEAFVVDPEHRDEWFVAASKKTRPLIRKVERDVAAQEGQCVALDVDTAPILTHKAFDEGLHQRKLAAEIKEKQAQAPPQFAVEHSDLKELSVILTLENFIHHVFGRAVLQADKRHVKKMSNVFNNKVNLSQKDHVNWGVRDGLKIEP